MQNLEILSNFCFSFINKNHDIINNSKLNAHLKIHFKAFTSKPFIHAHVYNVRL